VKLPQGYVFIRLVVASMPINLAAMVA